AVFEIGEGALAIVNDWDFTLGETVTRRIFTHLEFNRRTYKGRVFVQSQNPPHGLEIKKGSAEILLRLGFQVALPEQNRVLCARRGATSALVTVQDETHLVDIRLGTDDDRDGLDSVLNSLLTGFPQSELIEGPRKSIG